MSVSKLKILIIDQLNLGSNFYDKMGQAYLKPLKIQTDKNI
jgi:hypothetical protein